MDRFLGSILDEYFDSSKWGDNNMSESSSHMDIPSSPDQEPSNFQIDADQPNIEVSFMLMPISTQKKIIELSTSTLSGSQTMAFTRTPKNIYITQIQSQKF
ncbi:hypothetical protein RclHR1_06060020 [Rhizophagus clarus]|nr:hypothetical protein RclHR1_06060020 [Rhizophagus clarus]